MYSSEEMNVKNPNFYAEFGKEPKVYDPADCCLPDGFMNCPGVSQLGMCPNYMSQRCSVKWDEKCDSYLQSISDSPVELKKFNRDTLTKRFCTLSPDSNCKTSCQKFDPTAQSSASVCKYVGNEVLKNKNDQVDIGWTKPINISPDYMGGCNFICNTKSTVEPDDVVVNNNFKYGINNDILNHICDISVNSKIDIKNKQLDKYCRMASPKYHQYITEKEGKQKQEYETKLKMAAVAQFKSEQQLSAQKPVDYSIDTVETKTTMTQTKSWVNVFYFIIFLLICVFVYYGVKDMKKGKKQ